MKSQSIILVLIISSIIPWLAVLNGHVDAVKKNDIDAAYIGWPIVFVLDNVTIDAQKNQLTRGNCLTGSSCRFNFFWVAYVVDVVLVFCLIITVLLITKWLSKKIH
jgi:hypothetical protein